MGDAETATGGGWDWVLFWTIIAAIVGALALIGVVVAIIAYRRQFPKRAVEYSVEVRPLVERSLPEGTIEVRANGTAMADPHFVGFNVWSNSRADIPSASFDAGRPIVFEVTALSTVVVQITTHDLDLELETSDGNSSIRLPAQLIRAASRAEITLVCDGKPEITPQSPLIDIPVAVNDPDEVESAHGPVVRRFRRVVRKRPWVLPVAGGAYIVLALGFIAALFNTLVRALTPG